MKYNRKLIIPIFIFAFLFIGLLNIAMVHATYNQWTINNNYPGTIRSVSDSSAIVYNNTIYNFPNLYNSNFTTSIQKYNPINDTWSTTNYFTTNTYYSPVVIVGTKIYKIAGFIGSGNTTNKVDILDLNTNTNSTTYLYTSLMSVAATVYNDKIYVFGGINYSSGTSNSTQIYNTITNTWSHGAIMPIAMSNATANTIDNTIYVYYSSKIYKYYPITDTWDTQTITLPNLSYPTSTVYNKKLYIFSGNTTVIFDSITNKYIYGNNVPTNRNGASSVLYNNKIWVIGGSNTAAVESLDVYNPINLTNPASTPLYTNKSYDWNLGYQDSDYNLDITYDYNFGFDNDTNFDNGVLSTRLTNQILSVLDTNVDYYNINYTPTTNDINTGLYTWIKINKYINGVYDSNTTLYTSDTRNILYNIDSNLTNPPAPVYIYKDYNFDMNVQDFAYDSNKTYKYDFGINTTKSLTGAEQLQSLQSFTLDSNSQTIIPITQDFNKDQVNNNYYSYVTIYQYENGTLLDSNTYWSSDTFTPLDNLDANLYAPNYTDFANRLYPTRLYDWNGIIQDLSYNPNRTYTYTLGVNDTNSLDGNETILTIGASLGITDTNTTTYYLSGEIPSSYADSNIYSYITIKTYDNNNLLETKTYWTDSTKYVNWGLLKLATFDEISKDHLDNNVKIYDSTNNIYFTADVNGVILEDINSDGLNGYNDANIYRIVVGTTTHPNRQLDMLLSKTASVDENVYLLDDANGSNITYKVKNMDDTLWANKFLMFRQSTGDYVNVKPNDLISNYTSSSTSNNQRGVRIQPKSDVYLESVDFKQNISNPIDRFQVYDENLGVLVYDSSILSTETNIGVPYYQKLLLLQNHIYRIILDTSGYNYTSYRSNGYLSTDINSDSLIYLSGYDDGVSNNAYQVLGINTVDKTKMDLAESDPLILVAKTNADAEFTGYVQTDGNYVAYLYDEYGVLQHTYNKVTVNVKKPLDEITLGTISPYDVKVGGLLNYSLSNQTASQVNFNIFAGTTKYYNIQVVDYNATTADRKYLPRFYNVQVGMGSDYTDTYNLQPYLVSVIDAIVPTIKVIDTSGQTVPNTQIEMYKYINDTKTLVESDSTDATGRIRFTAYPLDSYYFNFIYKGEVMATDVRIVPSSSSEVFTVTMNVNTTPESSVAFQSIINWLQTSGTYNIENDSAIDFNTIIYTSDTPDSIVVKLNQNGLTLSTQNFTPEQYETLVDGNFNMNLLDQSILNQQDVNIQVIANKDDITYTFTKKLAFTNYTYTPLNAFKDASHDIGQPWSIIFAILIVAFIIGFLRFQGVPLSGIQMSLVAILLLGLFLFMGWLNLGLQIPSGSGIDVSIYMYVFMVIGLIYMLMKRDN